MYRNYYHDGVSNYYVGFRTVEKNQNITITPIIKKYDTTERNVEGAKNKIIIPEDKKYSTILTAPKNNENYIFTHIHTCTKNQPLSYEFYIAYNNSNLGFNGEIISNSKNNYKIVNNTKIDTELKLYGEKGVEVFVKHVGISERYQPKIEEIEINYNNESNVLNWTQPIKNQEFKYTIFIDKINNLKNKGYTLCSLTEISKLGHYSETLITDSKTPNITIDFNKTELGNDYKDFDVIILAEQTNLGKITMLSYVYDSNGQKSDGGSDSDDDGGNGDQDGGKKTSNIGLYALIGILSLAIIIGAIFAIIIYRKYKAVGEVQKKTKETSMAMLGSTRNDKLIESNAAEQVDP